jgi:hypothetical protein
MKVGRRGAYTWDFALRRGATWGSDEGLEEDVKEKGSQSTELVVVLEAQGMARENRSEYDDQARSRSLG